MGIGCGVWVNKKPQNQSILRFSLYTYLFRRLEPFELRPLRYFRQTKYPPTKTTRIMKIDNILPCVVLYSMSDPFDSV